MPTSPAEVAHLLRRSGFAATPDAVAALTSLDRVALVDHVLDVSASPPDPPPVELAERRHGLDEWKYFEGLHRWWFERLRTSPTPLVEKLTLFWHNHFVSGWGKVYDAQAMYEQNVRYRSLALGDFGELAQAMALEPAMLQYLDNETNVVGRPNQNFARELMELFLLGVGHYTEAEVDEVARAWTGYGLNHWESRPRRHVFRADQHDAGTKTIFGITRAWRGPDVIVEILTNPAKRPVMARFIATKLWSWLAHPGPPAPLVDQLAQVFMDSGLQVRALVRAIFLRDEFWSPAARNGLLRSPLEWQVAACAALGLGFDDARPDWWFERLGQEPFDPPNVAGWKQNEYWVSTSAMAARGDFLGYVTWRATDDRDHGVLADVVARRAPTAEVLDAAFGAFGIHDPSPATVSALSAWHTGQRASGDDWVERQHLMILTMLTPEFLLA